ncbi:MAG: 2-keto-4-pentenoate hydratase [Burkholderiales bacterium]|nr:2-keto-4-pentenoate hydratase [Burkholderiales bacterium]
MDDAAVERAAARLVAARRSRERIDRLPADERPAAIDDAFRIQHAVLRRLGERAAGWKVGAPVHNRPGWGIVVASRLLPDGASVPADAMPMLGIEAEIAFRFVAAAAPRAAPYSRSEVSGRVVACAAIEIVDSRFRDYEGTPVVERIADFMSNGALIVGAARDDWRAADFATIPVAMAFDGVVVASATGGHVAGDPLLPAVDLVNDLRCADGVPAGSVVTTGTFVPMRRAAPGQRVRVTFGGFGAVEVRLAA